MAAVGGGRGVLAARLHAALRPVTRQAVHQDRALPRTKVTLIADAPQAIVFIDAQAAPGTATSLMHRPPLAQQHFIDAQVAPGKSTSE